MDKKNMNKAVDMDDKSKKFKRAPKKKVCAFCAEKVEEIDYKDVAKLKRFITEKGKIKRCLRRTPTPTYRCYQTRKSNRPSSFQRRIINNETVTVSRSGFFIILRLFS